jgi:hypothetical protein
MGGSKVSKLNRTLAVAVALALSGTGITYGLADSGNTAPAAPAAEKGAKDQSPTEVIRTYSGGPSEKQDRQMSEEGLTAVRHIQLARIALNDGYTEQSKKLLTQAKDLLGKIKTSDKPVTVATEVKVGSKEVSDAKKKVTPDLIPILAELQVVEDYTQNPTKAKAVDKAKEHLSKSERDKAIETLKLAEVGLVSRDLSMPLADTIGEVDQALKLIDSNELYKANLELKKISDGLVSDTTVLVEPTEKVGGVKGHETKAHESGAKAERTKDQQE